MKAILLLCDHAAVADGKLYINGGGISVIRANAVSMSVALLVFVPWTDANRPIRLDLTLQNQDGQPVVVDDRPLRTDGQFEVGRPAGVSPGTDIEWPFVFNIAGLRLTPGRYEWRLSLDGQSREEWQAAFTVLPAQG